MLVKIIAFVLPLGLDTLAVSVALGIGGVSAQQRMRTSLSCTAFEAAMPLVGLAIGRELGNAIGTAADYAAIGVLFVLSIHTLVADGDDGSKARWSVSAFGFGCARTLDQSR